MWVLPKVVGLSGVPFSWKRRAQALLLNLGAESWLSHKSAAVLHQLRGSKESDVIEATVRYGRSVRVDGTPWVRVHRSRLPVGSDVATVDGLRATSVERTLLDLATTGATGWSSDTVSDALRKNFTTWERLRATADGPGHVVGRHRLDRVLASLDPATANARSKPEWEIRQILIAHGLPEPVLNHEIQTDGGALRFEIDLAWPDYLVGFEYDSDEHHSTPSEIRRDRLRHRRIQQLGWDLRHLSSSDFRTPKRLTDEVADALLLSGWPGPWPPSM